MNLVACPDCARQYDVSGFAPGSRVRCVCDRVFTVRERGPLPVSALKCGGCGGVVRPDDEACPYCGGELSAADRHGKTLCPECYRRLPDDARHCHGCGVEIRPQALTPLPEDGCCPRCAGALQVRSLEVADVVECSQCGGLWLRPDVFERVCRRAGTQPPLPSAPREPVTSTPGRHAHTPGYIPCLTCNEPMMPRQFRSGSRASGVVLDVCKDHGVWLDAEELGRVAAFVREHGFTRPTEPRAALPTKPAAEWKPARRNDRFGLREVLETIGEVFFGELI